MYPTDNPAKILTMHAKGNCTLSRFY